MHTRIVIFAFLTLASTACLALEPQSAIDWPPKAVPNQEEGSVPDFSGKYKNCMRCHDDIMDVKTARKNVLNLHRLHLTSKKTAYKGDNRDCLTCHEMIAPATKDIQKMEGWFVEGKVYHPNVLLAPAGYWKKLIVRPGGDMNTTRVEALRTAEPYPYKPTLKRLVCAECHGPDSKIKTFYGAPQAAK